MHLIHGEVEAGEPVPPSPWAPTTLGPACVACGPDGTSAAEVPVFLRRPCADCLHCRRARSCHLWSDAALRAGWGPCSRGKPALSSRVCLTSKGDAHLFQHESRDQLVIGSCHFFVLLKQMELLWSRFHNCLCWWNKRCQQQQQQQQQRACHQCRASLDTGVRKIEDSDGIYNIEFKIWGVKKKKT